MSYTIEPINPNDDTAICQIIKRVGSEFGAIGEGFGPSDPEVLSMSAHYCDQQKSRYFVARVDDIPVGGCGIAPFNLSEQVCELNKLFLLSHSRGFGIGRDLVGHCLEYARQQGFTRCYLDTLSNMKAAITLYEKLGFEHLPGPLSGTLHNGCDTWMLKPL